MKKCPYCAEDVQDVAIKCRYCGSTLATPSWQEKKLTRSRSDRKVSGICGGMGDYFGCDSPLVRVGWVVATFLSGGLAILVYLVLILVVPNELPLPHKMPRPVET